MVSCGVMLYLRPLLSSLVVMGERGCEDRVDYICFCWFGSHCVFCVKGSISDMYVVGCTPWSW